MWIDRLANGLDAAKQRRQSLLWVSLPAQARESYVNHDLQSIAESLTSASSRVIVISTLDSRQSIAGGSNHARIMYFDSQQNVLARIIGGLNRRVLLWQLELLDVAGVNWPTALETTSMNTWVAEGVAGLVRGCSEAREIAKIRTALCGCIDAMPTNRDITNAYVYKTQIAPVLAELVHAYPDLREAFLRSLRNLLARHLDLYSIAIHSEIVTMLHALNDLSRIYELYHALDQHNPPLSRAFVLELFRVTDDPRDHWPMLSKHIEWLRPELPERLEQTAMSQSDVSDGESSSPFHEGWIQPLAKWLLMHDASTSAVTDSLKQIEHAQLLNRTVDALRAHSIRCGYWEILVALEQGGYI